MSDETFLTSTTPYQPRCYLAVDYITGEYKSVYITPKPDGDKKGVTK